MDAALLQKIGFRGAELESTTVGDLIDRDVLDRPLDGNHGEIHPKASDYVEKGIPFVMATDLKNGRVDLDGCYKIPENIANGLRKGFAKAGDVLLSHKATLGRVAKVGKITGEFIVLTPQTTYYRVLKPKVLHPDYLVQYFRSQYFQDIFKLWGGSGSTRAYLGITAQKKLPIVFPKIATQEKIAAILTAYDDLIENNRQRIGLLEKMAEEIYREWFVRLRFPGHEHTPVHKGVPDGWAEETILGAFDFTGGGTPSKKENRYWEPGEVNWYTPSDITASDGFFQFESGDKCSEDGLRNSSARLFPAYSIMLTSRATIGAIGVNTNPASTNQGFITCLPNDRYPLAFLYHWLKLAKPHFEMLSSGATFAELTKGTFKKIRILRPTSSLIERFESIARPKFDSIELLSRQNANLQTTRDLLLNRLISGKLRVDDLDIQYPPSMQEEAA